MDKVLYNVVFNRKNSVKANGTALIQVEAYLKGRKKYFSTSVYITPEQWDAKHRCVKHTHPNYISINKQIREFINRLEDAEMKRRQSDKPFTLDYLSDYLQGNCSNSFLEFMQKEISKSKNTLRTQKNDLTTLNALQEFKPIINFETLTFEFLTDFDVFLRQRKLKNNTVSKHFKRFKTYVRRAIDMDYMELNRDPFRKFKIRFEETHREYLVPEEITMIENLKLPPQSSHLQQSLDMFLFAIYTGLRYSDMVELTAQNLVFEDKKEWLVITMQKTGERLRLPVHLPMYARALDIFYKYAGNQSTIFSYITNQAINKHLVEIMQLLGITRKITFHTARHTQATYLLYKGVNITTVQKLLGHRKVATTQIYAKVMDATILNELQNVSFSR